MSMLKIGCEIHARLQCQSKLFSSSSTKLTPVPNSHLTWFDLGLPGFLPRLNEGCVLQAIRTGLALNGTIEKVSLFERKHYFYCDQPLGYQITQQRFPIVTNGFVELKKNNQSKRVRIERIQLEQDTGKSFHFAGETLVDYNRAGVGLVEIVSAPDMTDAGEVLEYVSTIQNIVRHLETCDGKMEDGSFRVDVNVSIKDSHRVEVKNLNSLRSIKEAILYEEKRLKQLQSVGPASPRKNETRGYDMKTSSTFSLRTKETWDDYRFLPEPDLPVLTIEDGLLEEAKRTMRELPSHTLDRLVKQYKIKNIPEFETTIVKQKSHLLFFEKIMMNNQQLDANLVLSWFNILKGMIMVSSDGWENALDPIEKINVQDFVRLVSLIQNGTLSNMQGKNYLNKFICKALPLPEIPTAAVVTTTTTATTTSEAEHLFDDGEVKKILEKFPKEIQAYKKGKKTLLNFFLGNVVKEIKQNQKIDVNHLKLQIQRLLD